MPINSNRFHDGLNQFATIAGIIQKSKRINRGGKEMPQNGFISEISTARSNLMDWLNDLRFDSVIPIRILLPLPFKPHMVLPATYEYRDIITATFVVNSSAYIVQLNHLLDSLQNSAQYLEETIALAEDICMSTTFCYKGGFCGTQAIAFALRLTLSVLSECYASMSKDQVSYFERVREVFASTCDFG
jgi:hypothetical protein